MKQRGAKAHLHPLLIVPGEQGLNTWALLPCHFQLSVTDCFDSKIVDL